MAGSSRSKHIILTDEARVLKRLRVANGMSLQQVAAKVGKNHSTISHIENGRMGVPTGEYLDRILSVYGVNSETFRKYVWKYTGKTTPREDIVELLDRLTPEKTELLLKVAKSIAEGRAVLAF